MRHRQNKHILNTKKKHINTKLSNIKSSNIKSSNIKLTKRKTLKKHQNGGKAISSGAYGCVFHPPLQCDKTDDKNAKIVDDTYISKLMYKDHAEIENKINLDIKKITDELKIQKYVLVDNAFMCKPQALTDKDKENFNEECKMFDRHDLGILIDNEMEDYITKESNIDDKNKLRILQIKSGGIDLFNYLNGLMKITDIDDLIKKINELNKLLIELLLNAIVPLRDNNYCHNDIKAENILINTNNTQSVNSNTSQPSTKKIKIQANTQEAKQEEHSPISIIDWGLYYTYDSTKEPKQMPDIFNNYVYGINYPYSVILFNNDLNQKLQDKINTQLLVKPNLTKEQIKEQIIEQYTNMLYDEFHSKEKLNSYMKDRLIYNTQYLKLLKTDKDIAIAQAQAQEQSQEQLQVQLQGISKQFDTQYNNQFIGICIKNFLTPILTKYYDDITHTLDIIAYFDEVYFKNADIWGILTIYNALLIALSIHYNTNKITLSKTYYKKQFAIFQNKLSIILFNYIINNTYAVTPFNIDMLVRDLESLNINPI